MLPDRVSNPGPLTYESGALPIGEQQVIGKFGRQRATLSEPHLLNSALHSRCRIQVRDDYTSAVDPHTLTLVSRRNRHREGNG